MGKTLGKIGGILLLCLILYGTWIKTRSLAYDDGGPPLAVRWEGFYHDMNLRDMGASLNACLNEPVFKEGIALRSAGWFSGWDCDKVANPEVIYSLNYSPQKNERYFCQDGKQKLVGRYFNPDIKLNDLEVLENWSDQRLKLATCGFFKDIFLSILDEQKLLLHCDAGRDRTGAVTALLLAMAAESGERLDGKMLDAIECDYRKTESLVTAKQGRMKRFLQAIQNQYGTVANFLSQQCQVSPSIISQVGRQLLQ